MTQQSVRRVVLGAALMAAGLMAPCASGAGGAAFVDGPYSADADGNEYYPGELLVRFEVGEAGGGEAGGVAARGAGPVLGLGGVRGIGLEYTLVPGLVRLDVDAGAECVLRDQIRAMPGVVSVDLSYIRRAMAQTTPYGITMVNAPLAWPVTRGSTATVAVLDTGVDFGHPDLPTPVLSTSFVPGEAVMDLHSHGTHCSGIVLARDNTEGVVGVAPLANLMIGKVLGNSGSGSDAGVLEGVQWAVANGADVISMSLGGGGYSSAFEAGAQAAFDANVVVVAAAGNSASSSPSYPAGYVAVISVSAVDSTGALASFSNFGPKIELAAPGVANNSTIPQITSTVTWSGVGRSANTLTGAAVASATGSIVYCGTGLDASEFPGSVSGNIAHIRRGGGTFNLKATNAVNAGAIGVVISNNAGGVFTGTLNADFDVPVVGISQTDGDALQAASGVTGTIATAVTGHTYASYSGTSMACPHVAGVAALLFDAGNGRATSALVRAAMNNTATDLGTPGRDDSFGNGLVNAQAAVAYLQSNLPCPADFDGSGGTPDAADISAFFSAWLAGDASADVDNSGGTPDAADISVFFQYWLAGGC